MPVKHSLSPKSFSNDKFRSTDYCVMRHIFDTHNRIGRLANEEIYKQEVLCRLNEHSIPSEGEVTICLLYTSPSPRD